MTMGLGMALMEETVADASRGGFVHRDLAQYHTPSCADVQDIEATWLDAAAIGNAVWHATGRRIRDLPITPARLLG
jgi:xanthine dehydrogenase YagR molybdenum-binding subunit